MFEEQVDESGLAGKPDGVEQVGVALLEVLVGETARFDLEGGKVDTVDQGGRQQ
jgi:hypothetical protein